MKRSVVSLIAFAIALLAEPALAAMKVFACEPEWAALAEELGGDQIEAYTATTASQDPHRIQARPSLIAKVRSADLLICTGAELEVGWLPILLRQSGNPQIQPYTPGYLEAALLVPRLEVPTLLDRAAGDVHPQGNPHIQTDPRNIARVAVALAERLAQLDPDHGAEYRGRHQAFSARWQAAIARWEKEAAPLKGITVVAHHKYWAYLFQWLGLREVATLEPKPGIEPSVSHLEQVLTTLQKDPAKLIIRSAYNDARPSEYLAEKAKIPAVMLPGTVGGTEQARNLFSLFDDTIHRLLTAAGSS
jgi:zinc/manganese transport system substrate-binding protein